LVYRETEDTLGQARCLKQLCITFNQSNEREQLIQTGEQYFELLQQLNKPSEIQWIQGLLSQFEAEKEN